MENDIDEKFCWKTEWHIDKFRDPTGIIAKVLQAGMSMKQAIKVFGYAYIGSEIMKDNVALNEGLGELIDVICGLGSPTKWDNANARLGVGDSNASPSADQTGLQGTNKTFKGMDTGYPQRLNQTAEWRATFGSADANYAWNEYTVVNAPDDSGKNLNRKVESKGTKTSGETWTLSLKITFS